MGRMKKLRLGAKEIASRLTGISCPIGGVSWTPPTDEQDKAHRLLVFLEDRRALYRPYDKEIGCYVDRSVLEIRERLTEDLEGLQATSTLAESIRAMRAACRQFLDRSQHLSGPRWHPLEPELHTALGELRALFGIHVACIACAYDLVVRDDLASILPPEPDEEVTGDV